MNKQIYIAAIGILILTGNLFAAAIFETSSSLVVDSSSQTLDFGMWYTVSIHVDDPIDGTVLEWDNVNYAAVVGSTLYINADNDTEYGTFRSNIVNSVNQQIRLAAGDTFVFRGDENSIFSFQVRNALALIRSVSLTIDSYQQQGDSTVVNFTYSFNDDVPEPALTGLFALGGLVFIRRNR